MTTQVKAGLTRRTVVAGGLLAVIVGTAFTVVLLQIAELRRAGGLARHSAEVLVAANRLERLIVDLETGERGFVITGDERFLAPWNDARDSFARQAETLERLAAARSVEQGRRARHIAASSESYVREYSVPTVEAARRDRPSVATVAATEEGKRRIDALRTEFDRFGAFEDKLAATRQERAGAAARRATAAAAAGVAGSVVLILGFTGYLTRTIVRPLRRAADMAGRLAAGDLTVRLPEDGPDEIAALERAFNTMGASLEASHGELRQSRARVVAAADEARRRIERDLHDGIQQRLVSLSLDMRAVKALVPSELVEVNRQLARTADGLAAAVDDLHEISRGIHPAILSRGGLTAGLRALARRSSVPVRLDASCDRPLPDGIQVAVYYVVSEALTNVAKHAEASEVRVQLKVDDAVLRLSVADDGVGGAQPAHGSGLIGLKDRIEATGGTFGITSPTGIGTTLSVEIPVAP